MVNRRIQIVLRDRAAIDIAGEMVCCMFYAIMVPCSRLHHGVWHSGERECSGEKEALLNKCINNIKRHR